ncbi:ThiF family adenylyltransferase [Streptomyces sp. BI20]|uniref:ThiF family adenylyltransferase n=1 Tax=Streptomyces sp. BI20 TaxID=3403460 RepID=UPI003C7198A6
MSATRRPTPGAPAATSPAGPSGAPSGGPSAPFRARLSFTHTVGGRGAGGAPAGRRTPPGPPPPRARAPLPPPAAWDPPTFAEADEEEQERAPGRGDGSALVPLPTGAGGATGTSGAPGGSSPGPVRHPRVKPALARAWGDRQTVRFGVTPAHAVSLGPVDPATGLLIDRLDGTRSLEALRLAGPSMGLEPGRVDGVVRRLTAAGLIEDGPAGPAPGAREDTGPARAAALTEARLAPDLATLSLLRREPGGADRAMAARAEARVLVRGAGRVGALIAAALAGAGVGAVEVMDGGRVEEQDLAPGGFGVEDLGRSRAEAGAALVRAASPRRPARATGGRRSGPALVVIAPRDGLGAWAPDPSAADWVATGTPHLYAGVLEATGLVGPLVLPGATGCAGCVELARREADPSWARMVAQWRTAHRRRPVGACDLTVATLVAGQAAAHALAFVDGEVPGAAGARWEVWPPTLRGRWVDVPGHPDCACGAGRSRGPSAPDRAAARPEVGAGAEPGRGESDA